MSFYTSLTGLNGAQADISTISNNIANVGTTGFKRARAEFGDIFATSPLQNASSAIGSGTILKSIKQQFTQGNIQSSLNALDLAISGQGFFALKPSLTSSQTVYTRNGSFSVNNDRYVVDSKGQYLQVFPVNADGSVTSTSISSAQNLQLPVNSGLPAATTKIQLGLNLPADATIIPKDPKYTDANPYKFNRNDSSTFNQSTSITIYDSLGNPTIATIYYVKTSNATDISPYNKWQTHVFVGDKELDPALITAKDEQGKTMYMNKFGEITSDPQSKDSTFVAGAPHPLWKFDDQTNRAASTAASVTGVNIRTNGFDFGDTDSQRVTIVTDPSRYGDTHEANPTSTDPAIPFWGKDMFTISDGNSQPVSVSIKAGSYTGTELAAEMTRAANEAFGDDKYINIKDTYLAGGSTTVAGNDVIQLNLNKIDAITGNPVPLNSPITLDLLGNAGPAGTPGGLEGKTPDLKLTRQELVALVQSRLNEQMNLNHTELGKDSATWVDETNPPIIVGYDVTTRALTFTPNRNLIGPNSPDPRSQFDSIQVYSPVTGGSDLGIPDQQSATKTLIRAGSVVTNSELVPNGDSILDPADQRFGIQIKYNKDTRQFTFTSSSSGETSAIKVGRAQLHSTAVPEKHGYQFSSNLAAGDTVSIQINGKDYTYTAPLGGTQSADIAADIAADWTTHSGGDIGTSVYSVTNSNGYLIITGDADGNKFVPTVRINNVVKTEDASKLVKGATVGSVDLTNLNSDGNGPYTGSDNKLLGIGSTVFQQETVTAGTGLAAASASAVGSRAIYSLKQTFYPNEGLGENKMTFTVDGVVGSVTLPAGRAYTGDTFAAAIEERVNLIQDPKTGKTVSGVKVRFDPDNNNFVFTSGTTGSSSQINVVGSPNLGLSNVTTTQGSVPIITVPKQAQDENGNKLYIDANGNITTQSQGDAPNWVPLYLNQGQLTFDTVGKLSSPKEGVVYSPFDPGNGSNLINLNVDYGKFSTQYSQPFSVLSLQQDGYTSGKLDGLNIDATGTVRANYTNGQTQALGKIMLANFANPNGLKQVGNSNYVATSVSGDAALGQAGGDGFGSIQSGSLERSNVDITEELVNLITAQRNFQANSKAIETETTLTQTIIQIRG
jgi:flagellar hook-basal body protein